MGNKASFQFLYFSDCSLLDFEDKFDRDNEFSLVWNFSEDKGVMVNDILDFHADGADIVIKF